LRWGGATTCEVDFMQKALNLNSDINAAIRAEIGERLRVLQNNLDHCRAFNICSIA
jgi:hypothetical protein